MLSYSSIICKFFALVIFITQSSLLHATPTLDDYATLPRVDLMAMSPNGELITFRKRTDEQDVVLVFSLK